MFLKINIKLKAYNYFYIKQAFEDFKKGTNTLDFDIKYIMLPKKRSYYTVLRSPHVNKTSREQFVKITHNALITCRLNIKDLRALSQFNSFQNQFFKNHSNIAFKVNYKSNDN